MARFSSDSDKRSRIFEQELNLVLPVGAHTVNVFQVFGVVQVTNQWARVVGVTRLDDLTALYATLYDGTLTTNLTLDGLDISGLGVNTFFTKDKITSSAYSCLPGNISGVLENTTHPKAGRPFTANEKAGADTFIQLNATAGTATQSFKMVLHFEYELLNGGSRLDFLL